MAKIELGHFVFISIPMGDAKFVTEKKGRGRAPILSRIKETCAFDPSVIGHGSLYYGVLLSKLSLIPTDKTDTLVEQPILA